MIKKQIEDAIKLALTEACISAQSSKKGIIMQIRQDEAIAEIMKAIKPYLADDYKLI